MTPWTPEMIAQLRQMAADGRSASEAGKALGVSRNAAIGKALRIGIRFGVDRKPAVKRGAPGPRGLRFDRQASAPRKPSPLTKRVEARRQAIESEAQFVEPKPAVEVKADPVAFFDLREGRHRQCRYPLWSGRKPASEMMFCGATTVDEKCSWCGPHLAAVTDPARGPLAMPRIRKDAERAA